MERINKVENNDKEVVLENNQEEMSLQNYKLQLKLQSSRTQQITVIRNMGEVEVLIKWCNIIWKQKYITED